MQNRAHGIWIIFLSFFLAYLLAIVPFPQWAMNYRPEWVPLVLIYWVMLFFSFKRIARKIDKKFGG